MKDQPPMLETMSPDIAAWLYKLGYLRCGLDYPRWRWRIHAAELMLSQWRHYKEVTKNRRAPRRLVVRTILFQPFSGVRPEWAEHYAGINPSLSK